VSARNDIEEHLSSVVSKPWTVIETAGVPEPADIGLGNQAKHLDGTVLYAGLAVSTAMVNYYTWSFSAAVYKTFLHDCAK